MGFPDTGTGYVPLGRVFTADGRGHALWDVKAWNSLDGVFILPAANGPTLAAYRGGAVEAYSFTATDDIQTRFVLPHNYAPGTDVFLQYHWSHNGTVVTGDMTWGYDATYAKSHDQVIFPAEVNGAVTVATTDVATTPQWSNRISSVQLSAAAPSASQIDSDNLEPDSIIHVRVDATAIPTITGGAAEPFLHAVMLKYQAIGRGTLNRIPDFNV